MKPWWKSKTIWLSLSGIAGAVGGYLSGEMSLQAAISAAVLAAVNAGNRFVTRDGIQTRRRR